LKVLVDVVEPVKFYNRGQQHPTTQLSALTSLVDAAHADAEQARRVSMMVNALLSDAPRFQTQRTSLMRIFTAWRDARPALELMINRSPILQESAPLPGDLATLGITGLEALEHLSTGAPPPPQWLETKRAELEQAAKPKAAVEFAVLRAIQQLVVAANELPQLKTLPPARWKEHVLELAAPKPAPPSR